MSDSHSRASFGKTGKLTLVTGGASGIGRATAKTFSTRGHDVAILDVDDAGRRVAEEITGRGGHATFLRCDITRESQVEKSVAILRKEFGRVDTLVNVAGIALIKPIERTTWDDYRRIADINLGGTFLMCKHVVPMMKAQKQGSIVNIASVSAYAGQPFRSIYSATKGAVVSFTKSLAWELAPYGIRVNCISPGLIETPLFRRNLRIESSIRGITTKDLEERKRGDQAFKRFADPKEVAEVAYFLASEESSFVNAVDVPVDSGWLAK